MGKDKIRGILDEALKEIQPDKSYEKEIFKRLGKIIKKINSSQKNAKAVLGGSGAKGTWLKTFDADIFVLFDYAKYKDKSDELSNMLEKILKKKFRNIIRLHGSRDYFQIKENKFTFEIVPILSIRKAEQAKNITDVSPLHSKWVLRHKKLVDEIKLTKQFCQAQNLYGAESYIRGFSGYICEILTVYYGSFLNLIRNAAKWQDKIVIDAERYYKGKDVFKLVNTSKLASPLIIIDPVQKDRNAAAALSQEKFDLFKKSAKEFLKNPSKRFFIREDIADVFKKIKNRSSILIEIGAVPLSGKADVVGNKLLKIYEFFVQKLQKHGFKLLKSGWAWDRKANPAFYFLIGKAPLSKTVIIEGPPLSIKQHVEHFRKMHRNTYSKNHKVYAIEKREYIKPEGLLKEMIKDEFVKGRIRKIRIRIIN